ncbi:MAG: lyase family protein, partial [Pseudomonadota bacterium]|nr:lyase family protein [Pseudomonadota bacterium]
MANKMFQRLSSTPEILETFSDANFAQSMLEVEVSVVHALAMMGVCSRETSDLIVSCCNIDNFDIDNLIEQSAKNGTIVVPFVQQLTELVDKVDPHASVYVHYGITSQDVIDTAMVLQLKKAFSLIESDILSIKSSLKKLSDENSKTLMVGRTLLQPSAPVTFGQKTKGWLQAITFDWDRIERDAESAFVVQMGGAVGNLSAFGTQGNKFRSFCAQYLNIGDSGDSWHVYRNNLISYCSSVSMLVGSLGKIAKDLSLLLQAEVAEVTLSGASGKGGSSAMPHKNNPVGCLVALSAASRAPHLLSNLFSTIAHEHERALGGWQSEWVTVPGIIKAAAGACRAMSETCQEIKPDREKMRDNLDSLNGVVMSECLTLALAEK